MINKKREKLLKLLVDCGDINLIISSLSGDELLLFKKLFNNDYNNFDISVLTDIEIDKLINILNNNKISNLEELDLDTGINNANNDGFLSNNTFRDRFMRLPYKKLSYHEEEVFMKRLKLSYYDEVDEETRELYIKYYGEMFPTWYDEYNKATGDLKERLLDKAIIKSTRYRDRFIELNMRLVVHIARRYRGSDSMENLCQEGLIGMIKSVKNFDYTKGFKFATYASHNIRQIISRYIKYNAGLFRIPDQRYDEIKKFTRVENDLIQSLGRNPSDREIAEYMNISLYELDNLKKNRLLLNKPSSLDQPIGEDFDSTLGDYIEDKDSIFTEKIDNDMTVKSLFEIIEKSDLDIRERKIIYMRYGLKQFDRPYSYEEIGEEFGVSASRVCQVEKRVLNQLRRKLVIDYPEQVKDYNRNADMRKRKRMIDKKRDKGRSLLMDSLEDSEFRETRDKILNYDLSLFDKDTRTILSMKYGFDGVCYSIDEIVDELGLTKSEVLKKESDALWFIDGISIDNIAFSRIRREKSYYKR